MKLHSTPIQRRYCQSSDRVECTLRHVNAINASNSKGKLISFSLDQNDQVILYAKRGPFLSRVKFTILDRDCTTPVGYLTQATSNFLCHVYELSSVGRSTVFCNNSTTTKTTKVKVTVAYILYRVPPLSAFLSVALSSSSSSALSVYRRVQVVVVSAKCDHDHDGVVKIDDSCANNAAIMSSAASSCGTGADQTNATSFRNVVMSSIQETGHLPSQKHMNDIVSTDTVTSFCTKKPYLKPNGRWGLDFGGRGRGTSPKNMQLVAMNDDCGEGEEKVFLQMVKGGGCPNKCKSEGSDAYTTLDGCNLKPSTPKIYHVDFCAPVTPLQAFGFALAQIDL
jgi:Tub family